MEYSTAPIAFKTTVVSLRKAVARGGSAADFLVAAYLSWFRRSNAPISLHAWPILDNENRALFERMLRLREGEKWSASTLLELEKEFKDHMKANGSGSKGSKRVLS